MKTFRQNLELFSEFEKPKDQKILIFAHGDKRKKNLVRFFCHLRGLAEQCELDAGEELRVSDVFVINIPNSDIQFDHMKEVVTPEGTL